jgi:hypothetical protein
MEKRQLFLRFDAFGFVADSAMPFDDALFPRVIGAGPNPNPIKPLANGGIPVALLISDGAGVIDFCCPWEISQDVNILARAENDLLWNTGGRAGSIPIQTRSAPKRAFRPTRCPCAQDAIRRGSGRCL